MITQRLLTKSKLLQISVFLYPSESSATYQSSPSRIVFDILADSSFKAALLVRVSADKVCSQSNSHLSQQPHVSESTRKWIFIITSEILSRSRPSKTPSPSPVSILYSYSQNDRSSPLHKYFYPTLVKTISFPAISMCIFKRKQVFIIPSQQSINFLQQFPFHVHKRDLHYLTSSSFNFF